MTDYTLARRNMVDGQLRTNKVIDDAVLARFASVPREAFVPPAQQGAAYVDEELRLPGGRVLLEPMVLARLLQAAAIRPTDRVLDVAGGSGYAGALLAPLCSLYVLAESDPWCLAQARSLLPTLAEEHAVIAATSDNVLSGAPAYAPYDVVLLQGALTTVPDVLRAQLADGGRLLYIYRPHPDTTGTARCLRKTGNTFAETVLFDAATPYIPGAVPVPAFSF
jgi:protein-L-isoaspartate(D-aspartate) O-methyltransferase